MEGVSGKVATPTAVLGPLKQMDSNHKIDSALPTRAFKTQISVHLLIIKTNSAAEPCRRSKASG